MVRRGSCLVNSFQAETGRMPSQSSPGTYKADTPVDKNELSDWFVAVEEFLHLLARAVRQFHTYPPTSPLCADAVVASHKAFSALDRHDRLTLRVTPHDFVADERHIGAGTIVEHELVRRLHKARVASLDLDHAASPRDFTRLCTDILRGEDLAQTKTTFAELLAEHGVELIVPRMAHRPEVLDVGPRPEPVWDLIEHDRARRAAAAISSPVPAAPSGPVQYLYPPEKGWVRLESGALSETISLVDLAILVDDPADIATMLLRLTDDDPVGSTGKEARKQALEQKFADVAMLFAALDGHLARVMFGKLAQAVLAIEPDRRKALLQRTILPGLLDGRAAGAVLRDFPDPDLAESLCLLLELETAAPEVVTAALQRLDLPADRSQAVASLVDARLRAPAAAATDGEEEDAREHKIDRFARRLLRVDVAAQKDFTEFSAFDLSIDDHAAAAIADVGPTIVRSDLNPALVEAFLRRAMMLLGDLERAERTSDLLAAARRYRELAEELKDTRPDVTDVIRSALSGFCSPARALKMMGLDARDGARPELSIPVVDAFGGSLAPALVALLDDPALQAKTRSLTTIACEHAEPLVPGLVLSLGDCGALARRAIVRACGYAGAGYEGIVSQQLTSRDEPTVREALRALARIGTARAAAIVGLEIQNGSALARAAAEEALWHFPPAQTAAQLRDILHHKEFVVQNPLIVSRLIERAAQTKAGALDGLDSVLGEIEGLRFRFWKPGLVRVALKARELRER
jgi:hypothetical protein